jgi:hypothetical protein
VKIDLTPEDLDRVIRALDHYDAYLKAVQRTDRGLKELLDRIRAAK